MTIALLSGMLLAFVACGEAGDRTSAAADPRAAAFGAGMEEALARGDFALALARADSAERYGAPPAAVRFTRGLVLTQLRQYEAAEAAFASALEADPAFAGAWYHLGNSAFLQERFREALRHYDRERALIARASSGSTPASDRDLSRVLLQVGRTYERLGVEHSALAAYERALALDERNAEAHSWLGEFLQTRGNDAAALEHARRALELSPRSLEYAYRVGHLLFRTGAPEAALPFLAEVARRRPGHEGATYNLGRALVALGRTDEGARYLDRVEHVKRLQEAIMRAEFGAAREPTAAERWIELGNLLAQAGYYEEARASFNTASYLRPGDLTLRNDAANAALAQGDTTGALQAYRAILRRDSTLADVWLNVGVVHAMRGEREAAREAWHQALRQDPNHADAEAYLARLEGAARP